MSEVIKRMFSLSKTSDCILDAVSEKKNKSDFVNKSIINNFVPCYSRTLRTASLCLLEIASGGNFLAMKGNPFIAQDTKLLSQYIDGILEEALRKLSNGDENIRQLLVEHNLRLVVYIAKKFENTGIGIEDLISIGTIGLMKAINTFNTDKNIKLATYASRCIENEILMYLRRSNKIKGEVSIDEPLNQDGDGNELLLSDILGTDYDVTSRRIEDEVDKTLLKASIEKLSNRERNIMELRFGFISGNEKTQKEVADMLRNFTKLYFKIRKKDYRKNEKRHNE